MSRNRAAVRARSIVGLYREETISTLPIDEVRSDLERLHVDATEVIGLARRLARGGDGDPAAELLTRLEQVDAADCEIANLERQSMQDVLNVLPSDLVESAKVATDDIATKLQHQRPDPEDKNDEAKAADARVKTKIETLDAALRPAKRRYRAVIGIGGSVAAIAASVVLLIAVKPDVLDRFGLSENVRLPFEGWSTSTRDPAEGGATVPEVETALAESEDVAPVSPPGDRPRAVQGFPIEGAPLPSESVLPSGLADVQLRAPGRARQTVVSALALDAPNLPVEADVAATKAETPSISKRDASAQTVNGTTSLPDNLTGVFIVDAARAPAELVALESVERDNRLGAKRGEASLRALGRNVLALIAFDRNGERIEAAVIEGKPGVVGGAHAEEPSVAERGAAGFQEPGQSGFELLELSRPR